MIKNRNILTPAFHYKVLDGFCNVFAEKSNTLVELLRNESAIVQKSVDIRPYLNKCTLDIICGNIKFNFLNSLLKLITFFEFNMILETAMGVRFDDDEIDKKDYLNAVKK